MSLATPSTPVRTVHVPGLGLDGRSSADLRARYPLDVVLLPGMGLPGAVPSVDEMAERLCARLGQGPVVLLGHSQGCQVVVAAAERDARVAGVVLLGPTTDPRLRSRATLVGRWLRTARHEQPGQAPGTVAQYRSTGLRAMAALWRSASPDRIDVRLRAVQAPVVVVRGTEDRLCDAEWAAHVVAAAPRGRLVELPGAAHMTVQTHPDAVAAVLRRMASEVS